MRRSITGWRARRGKWGWWLAGGACALAGIALLIGAQAGVSVAGLEVEAGNLVGRAIRKSGQGASGDGFVQFGPPRSIVALGDSVASGDGIEYGWKWTPDGTGDGSWVRTGPATPVWEPADDLSPAVQNCRRSKKAYPYLVAARTGDTLYDPSCSGSTILNGLLGAHDFGGGVVGAAQLGSSQPGYGLPNASYDAAKPDIVTLTVGMDDINFGEILKWCYLGTTCVTPADDQTVDQRLAGFKTNLQLLLTEIKTRGEAAGKLPTVVLTTYYDPFNPDNAKVCNDTYLGLGNGLAADEIAWMRGKLQAMNQQIRDAAAGYPKAKVVDLSQVLAGHEFCTADPWVYGISIWYSDFGNPAPFHPTPAGQAAIADKLAPVIGSL